VEFIVLVYSSAQFKTDLPVYEVCACQTLYECFHMISASWTGQIHFWCGMHAVWGIHFRWSGELFFYIFLLSINYIRKLLAIIYYMTHF